MATRVPRYAALWVAALVSPTLAGCGGPKVGTVAGTVKLGDKPVTAGVIMFVSAEGGEPVSGTVNPDGTYRVENVPAGKCLVTLMDPPDQPPPPRPDAPASSPQQPVEDPAVLQKRHGQQVEAAIAAGIELPPPLVLPARKAGLIPDWYRDPGTSGLSVEVNGASKAETQYDITLTTTPPAEPPPVSPPG